MPAGVAKVSVMLICGVMADWMGVMGLVWMCVISLPRCKTATDENSPDTSAQLASKLTCAPRMHTPKEILIPSIPIGIPVSYIVLV